MTRTQRFGLVLFILSVAVSVMPESTGWLLTFESFGAACGAVLFIGD